jgi:hypothetical protein
MGQEEDDEDQEQFDDEEPDGTFSSFHLPFPSTV